MNSQFNSYLQRIEQEINKYLPEDISAEWKTQCFGEQNQNIEAKNFSPLLNPTKELISLGGKRWRPLLLVLTADAASRSSSEVLDLTYKLTPLVEYVHNASLIHDDIEDSSDTRRGKPAAYISYGLDIATNAGAWLFFQASNCIDTLNTSDTTKLRLYKIYSQKTRCVHLGQAMDITWHKNKKYIPTENEYFSMVKNKTGTLSSLATHIGAIAAGLSPEISQKLDSAANELGAGFQIIDDVINLTTGNPGKKRGDDIVEGKKSLPVIKFAALNNNSQTEKLFTCFERAAIDGIESPAVEEAIKMIESSGAIEAAAKQGITIIHENIKTFKRVLGHCPQTKLIETLFTDMIPESLLKGAHH